MSTGAEKEPEGPVVSDAALAAEYVLGLLPEAERKVVEARVVVEPAMKAEVDFWEDRFSELAVDEATSVAPPPQLKSWIERDLFGEEGSRRRRRRRADKAPRQVRGRWFRGFVLGAVLGGAGVAVASLAFVAVQSGIRLPGQVPPDLLPAPGPAYAAQIEADGFEILALVRTVAGGQAGLLELTLLRQSPPEGRVFELWLIAGDDAPVSLGVLPDDTRLAVPLGPALAAQVPDAILAISDEPPGGAPEGAPTGEIRATVPLTEI